jgi:hypothetical protein
VDEAREKKSYYVDSQQGWWHCGSVADWRIQRLGDPLQGQRLTWPIINPPGLEFDLVVEKALASFLSIASAFDIQYFLFTG